MLSKKSYIFERYSWFVSRILVIKLFKLRSKVHDNKIFNEIKKEFIYFENLS